MRYKYLLSLCLLVLMVSCTLPSTEVTIGCDVNELIVAINSANASPSTTKTINLDPGCTYELTTVHNGDTHGDNGLPVISSPIVINGWEATLLRSTAPGTPAFRFFMIDTAGSLTLYDTYVSNGLTGPGDYKAGGAIFNFGGNLVINNSMFSDNQGNNGGAIYSVGTLDIMASVFSDNEGGGAGGAIATSGTATIRGASFSGNQAYGGGAITNWENLTISLSSFSGNQVPSSGGAIKNDFSGTLSISTSTIANNSASKGAGILNAGQLAIVNSTFSGNSAICASYLPVCGTTILNHGSTAATEINYSTIVNDYSGASPSAAVVADGGSVLIRGVIVANNSDGDCGSANGGSITASDANLDTDGSCDAFGITADPLLGPLTNNGGSTLTHALLPGSMAIDASPSSCPGTDQRGVSRPQGALCDLGSYESEGGFVGPIIIATLNLEPIQLITPTPTLPLEPFGDIPELTLCRVGPGDPYDVVSSLQPGTQVELLGTGEGGGYLVVTNPLYNLPCWVREADVDTGGFDVFSLPVIKIPPLPTKTPTAAPLGCMVSDGVAAGPRCVSPCPDTNKYPDTCTP